MAELFPEKIRAERILLTPLHEVDTLTYYEICSSDDGIDEVTEYVPWTSHDSPGETVAYLEQAATRWQEHAAAGYVVRPVEEDDAGEISGMSGLVIDWDRQVGNLSIWLRKRFWGRGYYGKVFAELAEIAFNRLDLEMVEILHQHGNDNSQRATQKFVDRFGGRHEGLLRRSEIADNETGGAVDVHRYTISRTEFETNRSNDNEHSER